MNDTLWHVIGNCFAEFSQNRNVIGISDLIHAFRTGDGFTFGDDVRFIAGQGLQEALIDDLFEEAEKTGRMHLFARWKGGERAGAPLSHKRRSENTMITTPLQTAEDRFEAELCLDERVDMISDHVTGQHLPGMILMEAGRQMFIATFERHFNEEQAEVSFLITVMNNTFHHFAFPVATRIRMTIQEKKLDDPARLDFRVLVEVFQADVCICEQVGCITVCRRRVASLLEVRSAKRVLRSMQAALDPSLDGAASGPKPQARFAGPERIAS